LIQWGKQDVMFAGGGEELDWTLSVLFDAMGAMSSKYNDTPERSARAYDAGRDGFVIAGGGGIVVLEELEHARRRQATIYAELTGWGGTCDAYHMCHPAPDGAQAARAMNIALTKAGVRPEQVDYYNAHGTSTPTGDATETIAIKRIFGKAAYDLPISSIKSSIGHMQGACGTSEIAACCLAIRDSILPPTINYEFPDPACDLDYVPNKARRRRVDVAVSNSFSFGGRNTAVVLQRYTNSNGKVPA
jgi:3-oxoacyl-[acyl-carrier-protein] synthase II